MRRLWLVGVVVAAMVFGAGRPSRAAFLTFLDKYPDGDTGGNDLEFAIELAVTPDGAHVYVAANVDDAVSLFTRDAITGALTFVQSWKDGVGGVDGLDGANGVAVTQDGKHVYVASDGEDAVAVFSRDAGTGLLTFVEVQRDAVGGVTGLREPGNLIVSADGKHVYVVAQLDNAVVVFARNATTGSLTFLESQFEGSGGVSGLDRPVMPALSPDGSSLYIASNNSDAVAVFSRNTTSGALTFVEARTDGMGGVDGLNGARSVLVSPDGLHVYVAGGDDHAIAQFSRNAGTGALTFIGVVVDDVGGAEGLAFPVALAMTADGGKLLVASAFPDNAVVILDRNSGTGALTWSEMFQGASIFGFNGIQLSPDGGFAYTSAAGAVQFPSSVAAFATPLAPTTTTSTSTSTTTMTTTTTTTTTSITSPTTTTTTESTSSTTTAASTTTSSSTTATGASTTTNASSSTTVSTTTLAPTTTTTLPGCASAPRTGCRTASQARLRVGDKTSDAKDTLAFRWAKGQATPVDAFGAPLATTDYRLCIYRNGLLLLQATAPAGGTCKTKPCWRATKKGFRYLDKLRTPDGLAMLDLVSGAEGKAMVVVSGRGVDLPLPPAPLSPPVTVQVQNGDGACWTADIR